MAGLYPAPKYSTIIEPFAGSARYALFHKLPSTILIDKYEVIYSIWDFIINTTPEIVNSLPKLYVGGRISELDFPSVGAKNLASFFAQDGAATPRDLINKFGNHGNKLKTKFEFCKKTIIKNLDLVKDWEIHNLDYKDSPDIEATWFIDPPYQFGGATYKHNKICYEELLEWCKSRRGQVIICENSKNTWLPEHYKIKTRRGIAHTTTEVCLELLNCKVCEG